MLLKTFASSSNTECGRASSPYTRSSRTPPDYAYGKFEGDFEPEIKWLTAELIAAHRSDQAEWGASTDCDRLDEAFAALNRQGIVARQDFSCCNNCGFTEIWDEVEEAEKQQPIEGYVFYHLQVYSAGRRIGPTPDGLRVRRGRSRGVPARRQHSCHRVAARRPQRIMGRHDGASDRGRGHGLASPPVAKTRPPWRSSGPAPRSLSLD